VTAATSTEKPSSAVRALSAYRYRGPGREERAAAGDRDHDPLRAITMPFFRRPHGLRRDQQEAATGEHEGLEDEVGHDQMIRPMIRPGTAGQSRNSRPDAMLVATARSRIRRRPSQSDTWPTPKRLAARPRAYTEKMMVTSSGPKCSRACRHPARPQDQS
jgi:hypothetical protein